MLLNCEFSVVFEVAEAQGKDTGVKGSRELPEYHGKVF